MIFISYRRIDTQGWAGRLFADLAKRFGAERVFMDINGGIRRGELFAQTLADALQRCEVLLVLIGPRWLDCSAADGRRRLDVDEDWVRREIATAIGRDIVVVPVRLARTPLPAAGVLPAELQPLLERQDCEITDERWDEDLARLVKDILAQAGEADLGRARSGLTGLRDLMAARPAVAEALGRSREVIDNTCRQIGRLEACKLVHDGLHSIEFECLRPLQADAAATRLRPYRLKLASVARRLREQLAGQAVQPALTQDLLDQLEMAEAALQAAVDEPGPATRNAAVSTLTLLLSGLAPRLDDGISAAAAEVDMARLLDLLQAVLTPLSGAVDDAELAPLVAGRAALARLSDELAQRVADHRRLQGLDARLRAVCIGDAVAPALALDWAHVRRIRSRIEDPGPAPWGLAADELRAIEGEIDAALAAGQAAEAYDLLREYFRAVATVFRDVDTELKDFCLHLSEVAQPLRTVLQML